MDTLLKKLSVLFIISLVFQLQSCKLSEEKLDAEAIVENSIAVSGGENYKNAEIKFNFRGMEFRSKRKGEAFELERNALDSTGNVIRDCLDNKGFNRYINNENVTLPDSLITGISDGVNSVHYFMQVPFVLNSPAVIKQLVGEDEVEGQPYYEIMVTFMQEGGGTDYHDEFLYWIHKENFTLDYLAYKFYVNGGGIRFRKAINPRTIGGIRFTDHLNFKTDEFDIPLNELDFMFTDQKLDLVSTIIAENIQVKISE